VIGGGVGGRRRRRFCGRLGGCGNGGSLGCPIVLSGSVPDYAVLNIPCDILFDRLVGFFGSVVRSIPELEDGHPDMLNSKFPALHYARHVDVELSAFDFVTGIGYDVLTRIAASTLDFDARTDGQQRWIGSYNMLMHILTRGGEAVLRVSGCDIGAVQMRAPGSSTERERGCEKQGRTCDAPLRSHLT